MYSSCAICGWKERVTLLCIAVWLAFEVAHVHSFVGNHDCRFHRCLPAHSIISSHLKASMCPPPLEFFKPRKKNTRSNNLSFLEEDPSPLLPLTSKSRKKLLEEQKEEIQVAAMSGESAGEGESDGQEASEHGDAEDVAETKERNESSSAEAARDDSRPRAQDTVARAAALLGRKRLRAPPSARAGKEQTTSVGVRRVGSATKARQQPGSSSRLMDALRKAARGAAAVKPEKDKSDRDNNSGSMTNACAAETAGMQCAQNEASVRSPSQLPSVAIDSAIGELLAQRHDNNNPQPTATSANNGNTSQQGRFMAALRKSVGILGDLSNSQQRQEEPLAGSTSGTYVRLATTLDDLDIANLRLSVFSDFSFDQRGHFCTISCQAIASRRRRGAVCVVATHRDDNDKKRFRIRGTAECSTHEFDNTQLGRRRPRASILYVTEVAVHPSIRRQGVGSLLLDAIDSFAKRRRIESIYLHVDVCNEGAISLYEKSGYRKTEDSPVFAEFTKSLNLHPGATKGRSHHLLYKDISQATWLPEHLFVDEPHRVVGRLGFEIPA